VSLITGLSKFLFIKPSLSIEMTSANLIEVFNLLTAKTAKECPFSNISAAIIVK
jgi:hypothetical protein